MRFIQKTKSSPRYAHTIEILDTSVTQQCFRGDDIVKILRYKPNNAYLSRVVYPLDR